MCFFEHSSTGAVAPVPTAIASVVTGVTITVEWNLRGGVLVISRLADFHQRRCQLSLTLCNRVTRASVVLACPVRTTHDLVECLHFRIGAHLFFFGVFFCFVFKDRTFFFCVSRNNNSKKARQFAFVAAATGSALGKPILPLVRQPSKQQHCIGFELRDSTRFGDIRRGRVLWIKFGEFVG